MAIKDYSTTPSSNTALFPEGMSPAAVNNGMRQVQADVRSFYDTPQWRDLGDTVVYASATTFTIAGDKTANYIQNQRIRCYGSIMGTLYGTIASSSYSAPNTTVTVTFDSGSLTSNLSAVALGVDPTNKAIPSSAVKGGAELAGDNAFTGTNSFAGKVLYPDDGELTISSGAVTVTGRFHTLDTESDAASDDLDTVNGLADGQEVIFRIENDGRNVVLTTAGNIVTPNAQSITLDTTSQSVMGIYDGALSKLVIVASGTAVLDEDDFASNSAVLPPSQQSVKAYVDGRSVQGASTATTSGSSIDFTGIPSWATQITVGIIGVSSNGTGNLLVQIGDAGGVETSGYSGASTTTTTGSTTVNLSSGFLIDPNTASGVLHGSIVLTLADASTFTWSCMGVVGNSDLARNGHVGGSKSLTAALDRVRITLSTGSFDAGKVNISYR